MRKKRMTLEQALNRLLELAQAKLDNAIAKNKTWDIEHYKNDIEVIKAQMK